MGAAGIEPTSSRLEREILPLNYTPMKNLKKLRFKGFWVVVL